MDQIQIANILLTRRCNLRCDYCALVQDYPGMPTEYPKMADYAKSELGSEEWIEIIKALKRNNPNVFLIFYGGEPFLYKDLAKIIRYCNSNNCQYTIISNNTSEIQPKIQQLYNDTGIISGFSASVDPIIAADHRVSLNDDAVRKSIEGFHNLIHMKRSGMAKDVVAEITVTNENKKWLYEAVKMLSENDIYSSITTLDIKKSPYYDFSNISDTSLLVERDQIISEQFMKIMADNSLKVHIPELLSKLYAILPCEMKCNIHKDVHNVSIDSNGMMRLCLRIRGIVCPREYATKAITNYGRISPQFLAALDHDYNCLCKGCNHTCLLMSNYFSKGIIEH